MRHALQALERKRKNERKKEEEEDERIQRGKHVALPPLVLVVLLSGHCPCVKITILSFVCFIKRVNEQGDDISAPLPLFSFRLLSSCSHALSFAVFFFSLSRLCLCFTAYIGRMLLEEVAREHEAADGA